MSRVNDGKKIKTDSTTPSRQLQEVVDPEEDVSKLDDIDRLEV